MSLILTSPPAVEPVSLAQAKLHLRLDDDAEDALVASLVTAARMTLERHAGLALIEQGWSLFLDGWPKGREIAVPLSPVSEVTSLTVYGEDETPAEIDPAHYVVDLGSRPARLVLRGSRAWAPPGKPAAGIEVALVAGFGPAASDVPAPLTQAALQLVAHWFEHREAVGEGAASALPYGVGALLSPWRSIRL